MKILALFLLLASTSIFAFAGKGAPLPEELLNAKTAFIVNQTGYQQVTDGAYDALIKWNRFAVAKSKADADIVIVFTMNNKMDEGDTIRRTEMQVFTRQSEEAVFQTIQRRDAFRNYGTSAKNCIDEFKSRMKNH